MRDRLPALEELAGQRLAVDRREQGLAHAAVAQQRVVEVEVDMLVDEARLELDVEARAVALLEGERLVERQAELARDVVDRAREEVRLQRRGVLDGADRDAPEMRLVAGPAGIWLQNEMRAGDDLREGPKCRPGRVGSASKSVRWR
jgi:hypothetical protein